MVQKGEILIFGQQSIDISPTDVVRYSCWGGQQTAPFFVLYDSIDSFLQRFSANGADGIGDEIALCIDQNGHRQ